MLFENALNIYTDGSMLSRPRTGGIGIKFVIIDGLGNPQIINEFDYPGYKQATNNEMELEACIKGPDEALDESNFQKYSRIEIFTDSQYVAKNYKNAMFVWPKTGWKNKSTGRPILHVNQWKRLLRLLRRAQQARRRVTIRWVKGHKSNPYNKAADKAAKRSATNPLNRPLSTVSVRRKTTSKKTEIGSVKMEGQQLVIQVLTVEYMGSPHRLWKYKYEVLSKDSKYHGNVDEVFSEIALRRRQYEVRMNDNTKNPRIVELICELTNREMPESDTVASDEG